MTPPDHHDHDLRRLFAEYSGLSLEDVRLGAENFIGFNHLDWQECPGSTWQDKAVRFYGEAEGYVFDLLYSNPSKDVVRGTYVHYGHWEWFERAGPEVLEFGGGLGLTCSLFRDLGRRVTYVDVDGPVSRFARWYFARTGQTDVEVLLTPAERTVLPAGRQWDFVFSDSVIEHLVDPAATVETLARAVRPGGVLYLIVDAHTVDPRFPMHRHVHLDELLAGAPTLRVMEHVLHDGDGLNAFRRPV